MKKRLLKKIIISSLLITIFLSNHTAFAQTPGTMAFGSGTWTLATTANPSVDQSVNTLLNGFDMSAITSGNIFLAFATSGNGAGTNAIGGGSDAVLGWFGNGGVSVSSGTLKTDSGGEIGITSAHFAYEQAVGSSSLNFTITGKKDGVSVGTLVLTSPAHNSDITLDFTSPTTGSFANIDEIVFTPASALFGGFSIDDLVVATAISAPTVTTTVAASITTTGATLAGNATADGGGAITERGIVWSVTATNADPVIGGASVTKDTNGSGTGVFSEAIAGLSDNTQYSYKAYATNGVGTSYGAVQTFTTLTIPATHLNFDGVNDNVNLGSSLNTVLDPLNTFTVEAWVRPETNIGNGVIIGNFNNGSATMQFLLRRDGGNYILGLSAGNGFKTVISTGTAVVLNTWTHVAAVWDGSTTKIYINGVLSATLAGVTGASFDTNANPILIGNNNVNESFDGDIEEVRIWAKALTITEINTRKDLELFGNEDGLLAYYKFNQGTNNADNTAIAALTDNSSNSYNGALTNFTLTGTSSNWASGSTISVSGVIPTVSTTAAASITATGATLAGDASADGGAGITERGIVWSVTATNGNPEIGGASVTKIPKGLGTGVFSDAVTGLSEGTQYSYKAFATNGIGTSYGAVETFTVLALPATHLNFDGVNDQINLGTSLSTALNPVNRFSVEAWVRPETSDGGVIIGNPSTSEDQFILRKEAAGDYTFILYVNGQKSVTSTGTAVVLNTWTHVAGVWDGSTIKIYINGVLSGTTTGAVATSLDDSNENVFIGLSPGVFGAHSFFNGDIEEIRLWTKALTITEINTRKNLELLGNEDGLLAYYKFNQGTNNADNSAITTLIDNSINSYNGTVSLFTLTGASSNWASGSTVSIASGVAPTVSTTAATNVTTTGVTLAGNATVDGGAGITERGIVWSVTATNGNPEIGGVGVTKVLDGLGTGVFSEAIGSLSESTQYSYKAYAANAIGRSYGTVITVSTASVAPTITTYVPADNATEVVSSDNLVLTFSETIIKGTGNIVIKKTSDDSIIETIDVTTTAVVVSGVTATINPSSGLGITTEFYVQIAAGAFKDEAANNFVGILDTTTWSFATWNTNVWSGATDTNWTTDSNWNSGRAPIASDDIIIPNVANDPIINSGTHVTINNFTINASGVFVINGGGDLTVNGNTINNGTATLNSASSLTVAGISSGNFTYKRSLATTNWYLISSPLEGEVVQDIYQSSALDNSVNDLRIGFAQYNNSGSSWFYSRGFGNNVVFESNITLLSGQGYSVKLSGAGDVFFTGTINTNDVNIAITDGAANEFNLLGNPYPSYLPANTNADAANNILTVNTAQLQEQTLWFWDQSTSSYVTVNQASASKFIPPAQGFFVNAKLGGGTFSFTEAMQSHQATDAFSRTTTDDRFEINLAMTDGTTTKNTEIYYINGTTTAFDNGYDSSIFGGTSNTFAIYTQTVSDSQGRKLGIQSLPDTNYENMTIPVGLNATAGTEITFSIAAQNTPSGLDTYLENRIDNTFTKLTDNGSYTVTLNADASGVGQFYLRTTSSTLGLENVTLQGVSIYTTNKETLRIIGLQSGKTTVKMFTLLGKQVLQTSFESTGVKDVALPKLSVGVYIVDLQTAQGKLTKKIIIQ